MIVLTVLVGTVCIFALASTLTQSRILSLSFDGVPASIWKLDSVRQDWSALRKQIADQTEALKAANSANLMLEDRGTKAAQGLNWAKEQLKDTLYEVSASLSGIDNDLSDFLSGSADYGAKVARLKASNARLRNGQASLAGVLDQFDKISGAYAIAKTEYDEYDAESKGLNQKITSLASGIKSIQDSIDVVFSKITKNVDAPTRARIENALYELNPTSTWFSKAISWFVILQPDVLSLILVVLMGVLGSSMQILHSLFRGDGIQSFGDYVLRLSVGAITALVIFIVAKAGVPIIADASRLNGDAPINPYFVSFVAIISGLMSEQAIVTVQNQGQRFFANGTSEPDRWARQDLNPDLAAQNLDVPTLARYLTISNEAAEAILKGSQRATSEQQKIVAIYLRKSVRDLFSDLPQR
ncbi:MAG: hypothetical protein BGP08_08720 [Rhizobiales bacterium 64-17]|nr:MAG: hypothetical protein BGP08_08720 [Rhizobiales bacterium 64-17]